MKLVRAYVDLMKLRVVELLIITTLPAMVLAEKGLPSFGLVAATLIGGTLAAGASNAFNMVIEADTDKLMARTSKRPLVTGSVTRTQAIIFACILTVLSLLIFEIFRGTHVGSPLSAVRENRSAMPRYCSNMPTPLCLVVAITTISVML